MAHKQAGSLMKTKATIALFSGLDLNNYAKEATCVFPLLLQQIFLIFSPLYNLTACKLNINKGTFHFTTILPFPENTMYHKCNSLNFSQSHHCSDL